MQLRDKRREFLKYVGIYLISSVNLCFWYCEPGLRSTLVNELILIFKQRRYVLHFFLNYPVYLR